MYHTPLGRCSMHDISTAGAVGIMLVPKRSALKTCCRDFSEDVGIVRYCYLLGFQAIELGKPPQGGVIYTVVHGADGIIGSTKQPGRSAGLWGRNAFFVLCLGTAECTAMQGVVRYISAQHGTLMCGNAERPHYYY